MAEIETAVVIGGTSGIGKAIALRFADNLDNPAIPWLPRRHRRSVSLTERMKGLRDMAATAR
ncbi:hypothetical protein [Paracoccus mutanolyticus]|uniref:hypothetical protein n=1 Tax=Paracoccus mutanolyticus TaxID=1499308 RepID=UPI001674C6D8|nr:hypothetical protein [Paracoccus mutanolyticus]